MTPPQWVNDALCGQAPRWSEVRQSAGDVLDVCATLEVSGLVHDRLARSRRDTDWPDHVRRQLELRAHRAAVRELVLAREVSDVLAALAAHGVFPILLKGAALAYTVYDSPVMRPRVDTDLFITRDQVTAAREILRARGYVEPPMTDGELVFCQFQMARTDPCGIEHVFDLHWKISSQALFADLVTFSELQEAAISVPALGRFARTADLPHGLLLACIHPVMHHRNTDRLIWTYDVDVLVRRMSDEEMHRFAQLALDKRVAVICARQLSLAIERFDTPVAADVMNRLSRPAAEPASVYLRAHRRWHHEVVWNVRALQTWSDRIRLVREVLFPDVRYMLNTYGLGRSGVILLPVLYLHRCARGAVRVLARRK